MTDQMRAEFEVFWNAPEQEELRMSCAKGWVFEVWQASRAALVIELPERVEKETGYTEDDEFYNLAVDRCQQAIEAAGVRVKQ